MLTFGLTAVFYSNPYETASFTEYYIQLRSLAKEKGIPGAVETIHYMRHYSVWSLIMMFFVFSFIGWLWEVSLHLVEDGAFVNRGVLHGPWLPIYGSGGVLILILLQKLRARPVAEFAGIVILCGMAFAYVLAPLLDNLIRRLQMKLLIPVCLLLLCAYAADTVYSSGHPNTGKGITDYESRQIGPFDGYYAERL